MEAINAGEEKISQECIENLLQPTKRRGRGKALKTLLLEADMAKRASDAGHQKLRHNDSSTEDDTPRRTLPEAPNNMLNMGTLQFQIF